MVPWLNGSCGLRILFSYKGILKNNVYLYKIIEKLVTLKYNSKKVLENNMLEEEICLI